MELTNQTEQQFKEVLVSEITSFEEDDCIIVLIKKFDDQENIRSYTHGSDHEIKEMMLGFVIGSDIETTTQEEIDNAGNTDIH